MKKKHDPLELNKKPTTVWRSQNSVKKPRGVKPKVVKSNSKLKTPSTYAMIEKAEGQRAPLNVKTQSNVEGSGLILVLFLCLYPLLLSRPAT